MGSALLTAGVLATIHSVALQVCFVQQRNKKRQKIHPHDFLAQLRLSSGNWSVVRVVRAAPVCASINYFLIKGHSLKVSKKQEEFSWRDCELKNKSLFW